eukprot:jgi/Chlat1/4677/Chrsp3S05611
MPCVILRTCCQRLSGGEGEGGNVVVIVVVGSVARGVVLHGDAMGAEGSKPAAAAAADLPGIVTVRSYDPAAASASLSSVSSAASASAAGAGAGVEEADRRSERTPVETLIALQTFQPLLPAVPEPSWKELIPRNPLTPGEPATGKVCVIDSSTTKELLDLYVRWCREAVIELSKNQESVHRGVEDAEARAERLLQWLAQAARSTTRSAKDLQQVHALQSELAEAQRRLDDVLVSYEKLCGRLEGARGRIR